MSYRIFNNTLKTRNLTNNSPVTVSQLSQSINFGEEEEAFDYDIDIDTVYCHNITDGKNTITVDDVYKYINKNNDEESEEEQSPIEVDNRPVVNGGNMFFNNSSKKFTVVKKNGEQTCQDLFGECSVDNFTVLAIEIQAVEGASYDTCSKEDIYWRIWINRISKDNYNITKLKNKRDYVIGAIFYQVQTNTNNSIGFNLTTVDDKVAFSFNMKMSRTETEFSGDPIEISIGHLKYNLIDS